MEYWKRVQGAGKDAQEETRGCRGVSAQKYSCVVHEGSGCGEAVLGWGRPEVQGEVWTQRLGGEQVAQEDGRDGGHHLSGWYGIHREFELACVFPQDTINTHAAAFLLQLGNSQPQGGRGRRDATSDLYHQ